MRRPKPTPRRFDWSMKDALTVSQADAAPLSKMTLRQMTLHLIRVTLSSGPHTRLLSPFDALMLSPAICIVGGSIYESPSIDRVQPDCHRRRACLCGRRLLRRKPPARKLACIGTQRRRRAPRECSSLRLRQRRGSILWSPPLFCPTAAAVQSRYTVTCVLAAFTWVAYRDFPPPLIRLASRRAWLRGGSR